MRLHYCLSTEVDNDPQGEQRYDGDALLLKGRVSDLAREKAEREKEDKEHRKAQLEINQGQLTTNRRIALFTFLLVVCTAITGIIAWRQADIGKDAATAAQQAANAASQSAQMSAVSAEQNRVYSQRILDQMAGQTEQQRK